MGTVPMWVPPTGPSFVERVASVNRVGSALTVMTGCQKASLLLNKKFTPPASAVWKMLRQDNTGCGRTIVLTKSQPSTRTHANMPSNPLRNF